MNKLLGHIDDPARRLLAEGDVEAICKRFHTAIPLLESAAAELKAHGAQPARVYVVLGYAYAASGNRSKALEVATKLEEMKGKRNV